MCSVVLYCYGARGTAIFGLPRLELLVEDIGLAFLLYSCTAARLFVVAQASRAAESVRHAEALVAGERHILLQVLYASTRRWTRGGGHRRLA